MAPTPAKKGPTCTVGLILDVLPEGESEALVAMMDERDSIGRRTWQGKDIAGLLAREHDIAVQGETINRHRRGGCICESR